MKILIVGQGPSKRGEAKDPLDGPGTGNRLAELAGLTREDFLSRVTAVNLLEKWHGKAGKGDRFPKTRARKKADELRLSWKDYDRVVLLGQAVAKAFRIDDGLLDWHSYHDGSIVAVLPHPSGIDRWYNKKENKKSASIFMHDLFVGKRQAIVRKIGDRKKRAEYCTRYLENFDRQIDWVELAKIIAEVTENELYLEVGAKSRDEWISVHAPRSYRLCYMAQACRKALMPYFTDEEMRLMPPETARWAASAKNISPAALRNPEVKEALKLPRQKAVRLLQEVVPEQHIEDVIRVTCKFAASQNGVIQKAFQTFRLVKDQSASLEDFFEFCVTEWVLSAGRI